MLWELFVEFNQPCVGLIKTWELPYGKGKNWDSNTWLTAWMFSASSITCGTRQIKTNKQVSTWHSRGIHCWGFRPRMDNRLHVSCVSMCMRVCVQLAQWNLGRSLHLINQSVKKWSIVRRTVWTMSGDLDVRPTLNSETKYSSLNCLNHVRRNNNSSS